MPTIECTLVAVARAASGPPTFTELCPIMPTGLSVTADLGDAGSVLVSTQVDRIAAEGKARLVDLSATPCELWVNRTDTGTGVTTRIFTGPVIAWQIQNRAITLTAHGLLRYLDYAIRETDLTVTNVDQALIVKQLVDDWQAAPYGNSGLTTSTLTPVGVPRDLSLSAADGKFLTPVITEMGGRNNGFDLSVDPSSRALRMWSPRKGSDLTGTVILDRRSIGEPSLAVNVSPGTIGSEAFAQANSLTAGTITATASNLTLRASLGRSYVTRSYQDVSNPATLTDHANRLLTDSSTPAWSFAPTILPVAGFGWGDFDVGDLITYDYDAGLGQQTFTVRVASITLSVDEGRETLRIGVV